MKGRFRPGRLRSIMKKQRLLYLENLRVALMVLVVLQHAMRAYGTSIWWFVKDGYAPLLERFAAVNSSYFMSSFFAMSFYFMGASYDRKGFWRFHADRFLRLGIPLALYVAFVASAMMYAYFTLSRGYGPISFAAYIRDYYLGGIPRPSDWGGPTWPDLNFGHLWFIEHLCIYGVLYSLYRAAASLSPRRNPRTIPFPSTAKIAAFALVLAGATFAVRARYPLYKWLGVFGFIQTEPAHLPFYLAMFAVGIAAFRHEWLAAMPEKTGRICLIVGLSSAAAIALHPVEPRFFGGISFHALQYAIFETLACVGLVVGLPYAFRRYASGQGVFMKALSSCSYIGYIIHLPIVVAAQYLMTGFRMNPYLKFAVVSVISLPVTYALSFLLKKLPYAKTYL